MFVSSGEVGDLILESLFEAPSSDDVDELGRSRGIQVAPHTSSTSHGLRERGRGRREQHGQKNIKSVMFTQKHNPVMFTAPAFATSLLLKCELCASPTCHLTP